MATEVQHRKRIGFKKNISTFSLTMTGVATIIGSGWLLGTQKIAEIAGPAGLISWLIGAFVAFMVGLFYIEIGSCFPSSGGIGYYSHRTHGRFCGFLTSWINWLSIVAVAPIEALAIIQYLSQLTPHMQLLYNINTHSLSLLGIFYGTLLMLFFMFINNWSVRFFIRFNNFFTIIKVLVPLLTIIALCISGLHHENFGNSVSTFMPYGWKAVLTSVVACGVVMSFNGFQLPLTFSEEIKSPKTMLPIAVLGSIVFCLIVYLFLQYVFIGSINPLQLAQQGWAHINFRSPYVDLLTLANLQIMVTLIYINSAISPGACAVAYLASSSRIMFSLSKERHLPQTLSYLHPVHHTPRNALIVSTLIGIIFLLVFKGWYQLVAVISVLHLFSYVPAPVITIANRIKHRDLLKARDQFMLPGAAIIAPLLLLVLSILLFYAAWPLNAEIAFLMIPGLLFYTYYEGKLHKGRGFLRMLKGASWMLIYFIGIVTISYFGNNILTENHNYFSTTTSFICLAFLSLFVFIYGAYFTYTQEGED
jgi:amino acid transporter